MAKETQNPQILTKEQIAVLDLISRAPYFCKNYYFTGGTPLAAFYLQHRFSEDLDFFSEREIHLPSVRNFLNNARKKLAIKKIDYAQFLGLHTFQLHFNEHNSLKVDFNYYPFGRIEKGMAYKNFPVDSILDIAVNKVHTIFMKPRARDYIDIYFIIKEKQYAFDRLISYAKAKFDWHIDPIQFGIRLAQAAETSDYPRMIKPINHAEWKEFFLGEAGKLKKKIFK